MRPSIDGSRLDRRRHVMQIMIIMRLALLDAGRAVLKRSWRIEGYHLIDLVLDRRRQDHGRRRVLQVVI